MSSPVSDDETVLEQSLRSLASILFSGERVEETLAAIARLAEETIPGCDSASVTVIEEGEPRTWVSTSELAAVVDGRQYATDAGPCLRHYAEVQEVVRVDSSTERAAMAEDERRRGRTGCARAPCHSPWSPKASRSAGALNLYSRSEKGFVGDEAVGIVFAHQAAITLADHDGPPQGDRPGPQPHHRPRTARRDRPGQGHPHGAERDLLGRGVRRPATGLAAEQSQEPRDRRGTRVAEVGVGGGRAVVAQATATSRVQKAQTAAAAGIELRQYPHSFVDESTSGSVFRRVNDIIHRPYHQEERRGADRQEQ